MTITTRDTRPAALGGEPAFSAPLQQVAPLLPPFDEVADRIRGILQSGQLTNDGQYVREFEAALEERLGVAAVTVGNGTWALVLALRQLGVSGEVIVPGYTFAATAHAIRWSGAEPVFVDVLDDTFTIDPRAVAAAITPRTTAILAVHIYGHPCEIDELAEVAAHHNLALVFDAAHAFGARYRGREIGTFGHAEAFSFHATKTLPVGEGGCVATADRALAAQLRLARKFGDPGDEDTRFAGTNAKMQEFNAILGVAGLRTVDRCISNRREYAQRLRDALADIPGVRLQAMRDYVESSAQNFAVLIDPEYGLTRDDTFRALLAENIRCRKYFFPPLHRHQAYRDRHTGRLPVTEATAGCVLCLPFHSAMTADTLDRMADAIRRIHSHAAAVRSAQ